MSNRLLQFLALSCLLFLQVGLVQAQGWEKIYQKNSAVEYGYALQETADNGFLIAGYTRNATNTAYIGTLIKIDSRGEEQRRIYNVDTSVSDVIFYDIEATPDGGYIVAGMSRSIDNFNGFNFYLVKYDSTATLEWQKSHFSGSYSGAWSMGIYDVEVTSDSGYICAAYFTSRNKALKTDASGNIEWSKTYGGSNQAGIAVEIMPNQSGYVILSGEDAGNGSSFQDLSKLTRINLQGDTIWTRDYLSSQPGLTTGDLMTAADGHWVIAGTASPPGSSSQDIWIAKIDSTDGSIIWEKYFGTLGGAEVGYTVEPTLDGGLIASTTTSASGFMMLRLDALGNTIWHKPFGPSGIATRATSISVLPDTTYVMAGRVMSGISRMYALKIDDDGNYYENVLSGKVYYDRDSSCTYNNNDLNMDRRLVYVSNDSSILSYSMTDADGNYEFRLDTGDYEVHLARNYRDFYYDDNGCSPDTARININAAVDSAEIDFPQIAVVNCALVEVNMGTPMLRRCFNGYYSINYCNYGTEEAFNAELEVVLDPYLIVDTARLPTPYTLAPNNTFIFTIDSIGIGACGRFNIPLRVDCDSTVLGQTHCSQVSITPDTSCVVPPWGGANIQVDATCLGDSIRVVLRNVGGGMMAPLNYLVYEDNIMLRNNTFILGAGQSQNFQFEATGLTYRIEAQQPIGFPTLLGDSIVARVIERCNGVGTLGLVTSLPNYDGSPFLDIDCRENIGAYDPNDKRGFPSGVGAANYITKENELDYHIRFQNTGTDTAFTVVIIDTIHPALDIRTLRTGASSHNYTMDVYGENNQIVAFTFDNIMLVDSNANEPLSHGFVQFTIDQKANNPLGTIINNEAAIYFDFNAPIFTNTTLHTVGENFIQVVVISTEELEKEAIAVKVIPNPFRDHAVIQVEGLEASDALQLQVFNVMGQQVVNLQGNQNSFEINRGTLEAGVYVFRIVEEGQLKATGKFIIR